MFAICVALSIAAFAVPAAIAYDPYAWLVWGREVGRFQLDTVGGPAWKPLPVAITTIVAPFGGLAPTLWLVVVRTAALLAVVGVFRVADRLAGRWAGVVAVGVLVLSPDPALRLFFEGHSAPLTATLAVWSVDRHLAGKHASALVLGTALALDRPEAWPFLLAYAVWMWVHEPSRRVLIAGMLALVPIFWFGGDWWGSGSPIHGAELAQVLTEDDNRLADSLQRVGNVVIAPAWLAALFAAVDGWRRGCRVLPVLFVGALTWFALVVAMSAGFGYAALDRFLLPGAAILCVLAGVGVVRLLALLPGRNVRMAVAVFVLALTVPLAVWRTSATRSEMSDMVERSETIEALGAAIDAAGGPEAVKRCERLVVDDGGVPRVAAAWKLDVALGDVRTKVGPAGESAVFFSERRDGALRAAREGGVVERATISGRWFVYLVDCDRLA